MNNFTEQAQALVSMITHSIADNDNWKMFGFKSRPVRGKIFNHFIDKSLLEREQFVAREIALLSIIDVIESIKKTDISDDNKLVLVFGVLAFLRTHFFNSGLFKNSPDYIMFMRAGVQAYFNGTFLNTVKERLKSSVSHSNYTLLTINPSLLSINVAKSGFFLSREFLCKSIAVDDDNESLSGHHLLQDEAEIYVTFAKETLLNKSNY